MGARATVLGASGYSGGEVCRILARHPSLALVAAAAARFAGQPLAALQPHLAGVVEAELLSVQEAAAAEAEVCFSCLPAGVLPSLLDALGASVVVDLSDEHRAAPGWVYGLTEHARAELSGARRIANPGCYPTAALLVLVPLVRAGLIEGPVVIDALSGTSGAGRAGEDRLLFSGLHGSAAAYGTTAHRHVPEIEAQLAAAGLDTVVSFTPHLVPMGRGVLVTARARPTCTLTDDDVRATLAAAYEGEPFVYVVDDWPQTKAVAGSNRALVSARVDTRAGWVVCSAALDNLGKGAAGQAVQNANLALGFDESAGLEAVGLWP
jgi:N-acetyl-gamma-glutamyl-phosphate reductase